MFCLDNKLYLPLKTSNSQQPCLGSVFIRERDKRIGLLQQLVTSRVFQEHTDESLVMHNVIRNEKNSSK